MTPNEIYKKFVSVKDSSISFKEFIETSRIKHELSKSSVYFKKWLDEQFKSNGESAWFNQQTMLIISKMKNSDSSFDASSIDWGSIAKAVKTTANVVSDISKDIKDKKNSEKPTPPPTQPNQSSGSVAKTKSLTTIQKVLIGGGIVLVTTAIIVAIVKISKSK